MANIVTYVNYYKDKTFDEIPFNDMDALIFSQLSYVDLSKVMDSSKLPITIEALGKLYFKEVTKDQMKNRRRLYRNTYDLFDSIQNTIRYKDLVISNYSSIVDDEKQFGALAIRYKKKWLFVSFEGTDSSVIGWKEDFDMSYTFPVPSQKLAISFLENEVKLFDKNVYVGGHSKGGNLAIVAAMQASSFVRHRLNTIYNFDGPGLRSMEYHSLAYSKIRSKIKKFIPKESIIGITLHHDLDYVVVDSDARGIWQHDAFSWQCFGNFFVTASLSKKSIQFSNSLKKFLSEVSYEEREVIVNDVYTLLLKSGITNTEEVTLSNILKCMSLISTITSDKKKRENLRKIFGIFVELYSN